jgi:hypothetical protein
MQLIITQQSACHPFLWLQQFSTKKPSRQSDHQKMRAKLTVLVNSKTSIVLSKNSSDYEHEKQISQHCQSWEQNRLTLVNSIGQKWTKFTMFSLYTSMKPPLGRAEKLPSEVQILSPRR